jgi:hypothetical protein
MKKYTSHKNFLPLYASRKTRKLPNYHPRHDWLNKKSPFARWCTSSRDPSNNKNFLDNFAKNYEIKTSVSNDLRSISTCSALSDEWCIEYFVKIWNERPLAVARPAWRKIVGKVCGASLADVEAPWWLATVKEKWMQFYSRFEKSSWFRASEWVRRWVGPGATFATHVRERQVSW